MSLISTLRAGHKYIQSFPAIPQLNLILPDLRIIKCAKFALQAMPLFAIFTLLWQHRLAPNDPETFAIAVITTLCALSIIPQCYYWLGKRAKTTLPPMTRHWYGVIKDKLKNEYDIEILRANDDGNNVPTYQDLASLLTRAYEVFPKDFWQEI